MFSNFKDTFIRKPQFTSTVPQAILDNISKELPQGLRYVSDKNGYCVISSDEEVRITPKGLKVPDGADALFNEEITAEDILRYSYNAQKPIDLLTDEDGCILINGEKINVNKLVTAPMKATEFKNGRLCLVPEKFPDPFSITVAGNGCELNLEIQRIPCESLTEMSFGTVNDSALKLGYIMKIGQTEGQIKYDVEVGGIRTAQEALVAYNIYNAFAAGTASIDGVPVTPCEDVQGKQIPGEVINFWEKTVELEKALAVNFDVSKKIGTREVTLVNRLYHCILEKEPFKVLVQKHALRGIAKTEDHAQKWNASMDKEMLVEYAEADDIALLGQTIHVYACACVFGGKVSEISPPKAETGEFSITLMPVEGKQMYLSIQYCLSEQERNALKAAPDHIEKFKNAERV